MKKIAVLVLFSIALLINSCTDDCDNNCISGNADIYINYLNLSPSAWIVNEDYNFQWYQGFSIATTDESTIIAYLKNQYGAWETLPYTTVMWTDDADATVYSEEMWYSYTTDRLFFDFRNTHPYNPQPPSADMEIKFVLIENRMYSIIEKEVDINNHDELIQALNLHFDNVNVRSINIE